MQHVESGKRTPTHGWKHIPVARLLFSLEMTELVRSEASRRFVNCPTLWCQKHAFVKLLAATGRRSSSTLPSWKERCGNRTASKSNAGSKNMSWVQTWSSAKHCWPTNFCASTVLPCQKCWAMWTGMHCGDAVAAAVWTWHVANAWITATENHVCRILALSATVWQFHLEPVSGNLWTEPALNNPSLLETSWSLYYTQNPSNAGTFSRTYLYKLLQFALNISMIFYAHIVQLHVRERPAASACLDTAWTFEDHMRSPPRLCRDNSWNCNLLCKPPCAHGTRTCSWTEPLCRQTCPQNEHGNLPKAMAGTSST